MLDERNGDFLFLVQAVDWLEDPLDHDTIQTFKGIILHRQFNIARQLARNSHQLLLAAGAQIRCGIELVPHLRKVT